MTAIPAPHSSELRSRGYAVTCVLAAIDLSRQLPWFAPSVRDMRMLRIEELNDLMPAVQQAHQETSCSLKHHTGF